MYRNIDRVTDVITFALDDEKEVLNASEVHVLGDIYKNKDFCFFLIKYLIFLP